jgi:uncharacterized cupin superfamily protein
MDSRPPGGGNSRQAGLVLKLRSSQGVAIWKDASSFGAFTPLLNADGEPGGDTADVMTYEDGGLHVGCWRTGVLDWTTRMEVDEVLVVQDGELDVEVLGAGGGRHTVGAGEMILLRSGHEFRLRVSESLSTVFVLGPRAESRGEIDARRAEPRGG